MRLGIDFDNSIVCYDELFHRVALEQNLIPLDLPVNKSEVRNYLRRVGQEPRWTEMQGYVYGSRMAEASPFPGVIEFFLACRHAGASVSIISHKTRHPFLGEKHDLHQAAYNWLELQGFFDPAKIGLRREDVFFELTKDAKIQRIEKFGCDCFIDDLPELLAEPAFPKIGRLLFDPAGLYPKETAFSRARNWDEAAVELFAAANGFQRPIAIDPVLGGGNNRVYRVADGAKVAVAKRYFEHRADARDRFASERAFYTYLWGRGIRRTPEPLAWDPHFRLGLFSFVEGRKLRPEEVNQSAVDQALEFVHELNQQCPPGIPAASEACYTLGEHVALVARRVERLQKIEPRSDIDSQAAGFVREVLNPAWARVQDSIKPHIHPEPDLRILSPSDFGFHNALLPADGRLRFLDFEYAGWDDPAKLICDFFCQPQVPVPFAFWDRFTDSIAALCNARDTLPIRARLLLPAYQIKWACIMLNEFLRHDGERRDFAQGAASAEQRKTAQLEKARAALESLRMPS